jgi:hypothetical protein
MDHRRVARDAGGGAGAGGAAAGPAEVVDVRGAAGLLRAAAERQEAQERAKKQPQRAVEVTAQPVPETQEGANSPAIMPIPGAPFVGAR